MFRKKQEDTNRVNLTKAIDQLIKDVSNISPDSPEFVAAAKALEGLYTSSRETDSKIDNSRRISPEAWLAASANIAGILLIVGYEQKNVITSKALALLNKLKS